MGGEIYSLSSSSDSVDLDVSFFKSLGGGAFFLVDRTPCKDWTMCPLMVSTAQGQYLAEFEYFSSVHVSNFSFLIALSHVELTGDPTAACMYRTSASTLGRSYALCAEVIVCLFMCGALANPQFVSE